MDVVRDRPVVQCYHVVKGYGPQCEVLRDVSLQLFKGDFVFLVGPSGSGKTTLLRCMLGLEPVDGGNIFIEDRNLQGMGREQLPYLRRRLGAVIQSAGPLLNRTVLENIALPLRIAGRSNSMIRERVERVVRFVGLGGKGDRVCRYLCGLDRQRVVVARALVSDPVLLIVDEPGAGLDVECTQELVRLLEEIHLRGGTVLAVTHNASLPLRVPRCSVRTIRAGRVVDTVSPTAPNACEPQGRISFG